MIEKFLAVLTALVAAIEANTAALKSAPSTSAATPAKTETKKEKEARLAAEAAAAGTTTTTVSSSGSTPPPTVTFPAKEEVVKLATAILDETGNQDGGLFIATAKKFGVEKLSLVPETARAEVIEILTKKLDEVRAAKKNAAGSAI